MIRLPNGREHICWLNILISSYYSYISTAVVALFSDYRDLKKQITAIRKARQQQFLQKSTTKEQEELCLQGSNSEASHSQPQPDLVQPIKGPATSSSGSDPEASTPTKRKLFETSLPSRGDAVDSPNRGFKTTAPNESAGKSSGTGRMPSLARSMSALRRRQKGQAGGEHR